MSALTIGDTCQEDNSVARFFTRVRTMTVSDVPVEVVGEMAYAWGHFFCEGEVNGQRHTADGRDAFNLGRKSGT